MAKVTVIPAATARNAALPELSRKKRRVAGYGRVSSGSDEQFTSFSAQVEYYTNLIKANPEWEFVEVYTDEGISGLNTRKREGFNRMIADAMAGRIDLIITKSVSRFARNTVDSLKTIRELKRVGTEVYFEKENIYTFDGKGELLLTIMSSLAQEESRSISENITWGQRRGFEQGKVHMPYKRFLGYRKGADGKPEIVPEQAVVVELIYRLFLDGKSTSGICRYLEAENIPSPGGQAKWSKTTVESILTNEKYKGHALLQKSFVVDYLEKRSKVNEGEVPQYYVEDSHPAIIAPELWEIVQLEFERRKALGRAYSGKSVLSAKLVCEDCGSFFGSKIWHSTDKYRKELWQCNAKFKKERRCETPVLTTDEVKSAFIEAYNLLMTDLPRVIEDCEAARRMLCDFTELEALIEQKVVESETLRGMVRTLIDENASTAQSQEEYQKKYDALAKKFDAVVSELDALKKEKDRRVRRDGAIEPSIRTMRRSKIVLTEWDDTIWTVMVEKAVVHRDKTITFHFRNGSEITVGA